MGHFEQANNDTRVKYLQLSNKKLKEAVFIIFSYERTGETRNEEEDGNDE